jgi:hypothetical protein
MKLQKIIQVQLKLRDDGEVSRNWALKHNISRLGAVINTLIARGWTFKDNKKVKHEILRGVERGGDYVYRLKSAPKGVIKLLGEYGKAKN